jgi:GTP-binding protein
MHMSSLSTHTRYVCHHCIHPLARPDPALKARRCASAYTHAQRELDARIQDGVKHAGEKGAIRILRMKNKKKGLVDVKSAKPKRESARAELEAIQEKMRNASVPVQRPTVRKHIAAVNVKTIQVRSGLLWDPRDRNDRPKTTVVTPKPPSEEIEPPEPGWGFLSEEQQPNGGSKPTVPWVSLNRAIEDNVKEPSSKVSAVEKKRPPTQPKGGSKHLVPWVPSKGAIEHNVKDPFVEVAVVGKKRPPTQPTKGGNKPRVPHVPLKGAERRALYSSLAKVFRAKDALRDAKLQEKAFGPSGEDIEKLQETALKASGEVIDPVVQSTQRTIGRIRRGRVRTTLSPIGSLSESPPSSLYASSNARSLGKKHYGRPQAPDALPEAPVQRAPGRIRRIMRARVRTIPSLSRSPSENLPPSSMSPPLNSQAPPIISTASTNTPIPQTIRSESFNWYFETLPPTPGNLSRAHKFFATNRKPPKLLSSAARFMQVPSSDVPEVAFVGRSNVGKSSLLNAIVNANVKNLLARTSATRGFTKTMNFYGIGPDNGVNLEKDGKGKETITGHGGLVIVDMPGYGDGSLASWGMEIMKYIQSRKQLRRVFVLLDAEHGIKDKDRSLLASLRLAGVSHQVILSKMDKIYIPKSFHPTSKTKAKGTPALLRGVMQGLKKDIKPPVGGSALGEILAVSAEVMVDGKKMGMNHLRYAILNAVGLDREPVKRLGKNQREKAKEKEKMAMTMEMNGEEKVQAKVEDEGEGGDEEQVEKPKGKGVGKKHSRWEPNNKKKKRG